MPGGRQIPSDVIDIREYKKNNQVRDYKNLVISPFAAEANKTYLIGALPKGAAVISIQKLAANALSAATDVKIGDINDSANGAAIAVNTVYPGGGDLWIAPGAAQTNGYVIAYMNTGITDGAYAG